ncbi:A24 family peptidase [Nocardiopsis sp. CNT312]|uniref:prepilin peptidase n=1 Tax=Nocardiopsis sp. CNT312 TaxID=1137268 RepID=UPI0004911F4B|nr:A24 family peptidase [Nocardiopsis sp. CNT312]
MPTPSLSAVPPQVWAGALVLLLGACGAAVGVATGRLVPLFVAVDPAPVPATGTREAPPGPEEDSGDSGGPPPPRCPHCRTELPFVRGLPAVAAPAFRRRGVCPHCAVTVRPHAGVVAATAVLFALTGALALLHDDASPLSAPAVLWLVAVGVPLSAVDLRVMRLPDAIVAPAYPVAALLIGGSVLTAPGGPDLAAAGDALVSMVLIAVLLWLMWWIHPRGMGFGDVKLSGLTGLYAGWAAGPLGALASVFWAFTAFCLVAVAFVALRRRSRSDPFPLGPFLLAAALATVLVGGPLLPQP